MELSVWEKETFLSPKDVIIAGSGFVGLWSAYYLKKKNPELSVTIVDRGVIPTGASSRNAGFACFGSVTELLRDAESMGEEKMLRLVEMRFKGLERIQHVFKKKTIDFSRCGGYEIITEHNQISAAELKEKTAWLNAKLFPILKEKQTFSLADKKISQFGLGNVNHLVSNKLEGYLHPGKLCQLLLMKVQSMGVTVLTNVEITSYESGADKILLHTNRHFDLTARKLLVCTNAFAKELLPELDIVPARGQVLVTSPIPGLKIKGAFHYDEGYFYFRNLNDRILLGGARNKAIKEETTTEIGTTPLIQGELESFLSTYLLPGISYQITERWSGIMGLGPEKMPIVKAVSDTVFCAVRMSGMGVALAPEVGEKVAGMLID